MQHRGARPVYPAVKPHGGREPRRSLNGALIAPTEITYEYTRR
jgi:hypothetical protein